MSNKDNANNDLIGLEGGFSVVMYAKYLAQCLTKSNLPINVDSNDNDDDDEESMIAMTSSEFPGNHWYRKSSRSSHALLYLMHTVKSPII